MSVNEQNGKFFENAGIITTFARNLKTTGPIQYAYKKNNVSLGRFQQRSGKVYMIYDGKLVVFIVFPTKKGRRKIFEELVLRDVSLLDFNELCKRGNLVIQKKNNLKVKTKV